MGEDVHRRWKEPRKDADDEGDVHGGHTSARKSEKSSVAALPLETTESEAG